jgi:hypothetical protein
MELVVEVPTPKAGGFECGLKLNENILHNSDSRGEKRQIHQAKPDLRNVTMLTLYILQLHVSEINASSSST